MSSEVLIRGFFAAILSLSLVFGIYSHEDREKNGPEADSKARRYTPYAATMTYPFFLLVLLILCLCAYRNVSFVWSLLFMGFEVFLHITIYYGILLLVIPILRKWISSRVCAVLWILPNYLYFMHHSFMELPEPLVVLHIPGKIIYVAGIAWLMGFLAVMGWKWISHLRFRKAVLKNTVLVVNPAILELWRQELQAANMGKTYYPLVRSQAVSSPLSIGFFKSTIRVVLPDRDYSMEELALIFRHEIIHIGREDSLSKVFMTFCTAVCWFNPLMWTAMKRSAEDLELSCDETVLLEADTATRKQYAELLLKTAGDDRGFTTCLAASATSMRYRLRYVMEPVQRHVGGWIAGFLFFILIMSCGYVTISYGDTRGREVIFTDKDLTQYALGSVCWKTEDGYQYGDCAEPDKLKDYLCDLSVSKITGNYSFSQEENVLEIFFYGPEYAFMVTLKDHNVSVVPLTRDLQTAKYYIQEPIDWEYLYSLFTIGEKAEEEVMFPPALRLIYENNIDGSMEEILTSSIITSTVEGGEEKSGETWDDYVESICTWSNPPVESVELLFSHDVYTDYIVEVADWDNTSLYHIAADQINGFNTLELAPYDAHYTVYAAFAVEEKVYYMEFRFDVIWSDS